MKLSELFEKLSYGQLSNLSIVTEAEEGNLTPKGENTVIVATNEALIRLYSRFVLKEKAIIIRMWEHITNYHFLSKFAESQYPGSGEAYPYILDLAKEPFKEDVIRVLEVYNGNGFKLPLNDSERMDSVFTPQVNVLQVPMAHRCGRLSVTYQAKHVPIIKEDLNQEIYIPDVLEGALFSYIAYSVYSGMNTAESGAKAQEHMMMYQAICEEVKQEDLVQNSMSTTNSRFYKRGWI